jgi:LAO/AO transport system kinase
MNSNNTTINQKEFARLISSVEDEIISLQKAKRILKNKSKKSFVIGITGFPGVGKSTIINLLIKEYQNKNKKVGILAVDPSSIKSGGAFLGDRIRMQKHTIDNGVFFRSIATRGHKGGLSAKTKDIVELFKYVGFEIIIVETIGIGQIDVDIVKLANVVVAVTTPAQGDEIQLMKAGVFEFSNIFVLNKCDYSGSDTTYRNLTLLSESISEKFWKIPVIKMTATEGSGIKQLIDSLERKRIYDLEEKSNWKK